MKQILFSISLIILVSISSCNNGCDNENPRARIINNGTDDASVQIKTSGGNTENINNIVSGQTSEWRSFAAGNTEFTVTVQGVQADTLVAVDLVLCWEYDIIIDANNQVTSSPIERD